MGCTTKIQTGSSTQGLKTNITFNRTAIRSCVADDRPWERLRPIPIRQGGPARQKTSPWLGEVFAECAETISAKRVAFNASGGIIPPSPSIYTPHPHPQVPLPRKRGVEAKGFTPQPKSTSRS